MVSALLNLLLMRLERMLDVIFSFRDKILCLIAPKCYFSLSRICHLRFQKPINSHLQFNTKNNSVQKRG